MQEYTSGNSVKPIKPHKNPSNQLTKQDKSLLEQVVEQYTYKLTQNTEALAYLAHRKISEEAITAFDLGFGHGYLALRFPRSVTALKKLGLVSSKGTDRFFRQITIPIHGSSISQLYGRSIDSKRHRYLCFPHQTVFNPSALASSKVILCESILDTLTLYSAGIHEVIAVYGANGLKPSFAKQIADAKVKQVVFAYDADGAGDKGVETGISLLQPYGIECYRMKLPSGSDINNIAVQSTHPHTVLSTLYKNAIRL